ncbi:MAG: GPR endopeptidase [Clostridia bacterium]|nr:GPR endopeptidase [Clostridia bacterium]
MIFRTDLALERREVYKKAKAVENEIEGISYNEEKVNDRVTITRVGVINEAGEKAIGKPMGEYITLDISKVKYMEEESIQEVSEILSKEIKKLVDKHIGIQDSVLIVGLGNEYVTPDSLGPKVANDIEVTRHIIKYCPQFVKEGTREISAVSPGVLGVTGIETLEIVKGIVENVHPNLLIVIDSLCSKNIDRISSSIQISDTGIVPGAGIGNTRAELSKNTLSIPVIALGVPTVVEAATITNDGLDLFIEKLQEEAKSNEYLNKLKEEDNYEEIKEALLPKEFNFIVTPKEIDELIEKMSKLISYGINMSL